MRIAVTGASGNIGGQVAALLAGHGHTVFALSRRQSLSDRPHVTGVFADYNEPDSLGSALAGTDRLVFVSSDGEAAKMILHHRNVVEAAVDSGVESIVYLSGLDADQESPFCYALTNGYTEELLAGTDCTVSIVRASLFTEFFLQFLRPAHHSGEIRLPAGAGSVSLVSRDDVARCLAALAHAPTGEIHAITGRHALDLETVARLTAEVWRRPVHYIDLSPADYAVELARSGEDPWWAYAFISLFESVRNGCWATVTDEVHRLTGRSPIPYVDTLSAAGADPGTNVP